MTDYDFSDPLIREMVAEHHKPKEVIAIKGSGVVSMHSIVCRQCGQPWPCPARTALLTWSREEGHRIVTEVRRNPGPPLGSTF